MKKYVSLSFIKTTKKLGEKYIVSLLKVRYLVLLKKCIIASTHKIIMRSI